MYHERGGGENPASNPESNSNKSEVLDEEKLAAQKKELFIKDMQIRDLEHEVGSLDDDNTEFVLENEEMRTNLLEMQSKVNHDKLTGALSREGFEKIVHQLQEKKVDGILVILDMNRFKEINDTFGHLVGDEVLRAVVTNFKTKGRESDLVCRWGGDEFILYYPNVSKDEIEKRFTNVEIPFTFPSTDKELPEESGILSNQVRFSCGVEELKHTDDVDTVIGKGDDVLYDAKDKLKTENAQV